MSSYKIGDQVRFVDVIGAPLSGEIVGYSRITDRFGIRVGEDMNWVAPWGIQGHQKDAKFKLIVKSTFEVKSLEQAGYIEELYNKLESLITCETSSSNFTTEEI